LADTLGTSVVVNALKKTFKVEKSLVLNSDQGYQFTQYQGVYQFFKETQGAPKHGRQETLD